MHLEEWYRPQQCFENNSAEVTLVIQRAREIVHFLLQVLQILHKIKLKSKEVLFERHKQQNSIHFYYYSAR